MTDIPSVPQPLSIGVDAIRRLAGVDAKVVAVEANFAIVELGYLPLGDVYQQNEVDLYFRAPLRWPAAPPYGLITNPFLVRSDGKAVERQHLNHQHSAKLATLLGHGGLGFWSWNWTGMPSTRPEDLAHAWAWAVKRIREA